MKKKKKAIRKKRVLLAIILIVVAIYVTIIVTQNNQNREQPVLAEKEEIVAVFPEEVFGVPVKTKLIELSKEGRPGVKREIKYIVIHETGNFEKGTDAESHSILLTENSNDSTSWHYTVDDHEIYHHIPDDEVAWHAGDGVKNGGGNINGIGIELCVNSDGDFEETFDNATKLVAYLLDAYNLSTDAIKKHGDFISKDCPNTIIKENRMDEFIKKVKEYQEAM